MVSLPAWGDIPYVDIGNLSLLAINSMACNICRLVISCCIILSWFPCFSRLLYGRFCVRPIFHSCLYLDQDIYYTCTVELHDNDIFEILPSTTVIRFRYQTNIYHNKSIFNLDNSQRNYIVKFLCKTIGTLYQAVHYHMILYTTHRNDKGRINKKDTLLYKTQEW